MSDALPPARRNVEGPRSVDRIAAFALAILVIVAVGCLLLFALWTQCSALPHDDICSSSFFIQLTRNWSAVTALQAVCTSAIVCSILTSRRHRSLRSAIFSLLIGASPMLASVISSTWASSLGCYVNEHGAYTRNENFDQLGCIMWGTEVGSLIHALHMTVFGFFISWPFLVIGLAQGFAWLRTVA